MEAGRARRSADVSETGVTERRGDYGYDAPYALVIFGAVGSAFTIAAVASWWIQGFGRPTPVLGFYGAFFPGNALSFFLHDAAWQVSGLG